jgi:hypothetical protein
MQVQTRQHRHHCDPTSKIVLPIFLGGKVSRYRRDLQVLSPRGGKWLNSPRYNQPWCVFFSHRNAPQANTCLDDATLPQPQNVPTPEFRNSSILAHVPDPLIELQNSSHKVSAAVSSLQMKQLLDQFMKITFTDLFAWGENESGKIMLDRRACLLFHPVSHLKSLNLITRWLLLHHVEVSSPWYAGFWDYYTQQLCNGGSGIIIVSHCFSDFLVDS